MAVNSPLLKHKPDSLQRKKSLCATWDRMEGSESEEDLDNEEAMLCVMAIKEDI